jgi:hypothetical protein
MQALLLMCSCEQWSGGGVDSSCSPVFREIASEPIRAEAGSWRVVFMVAIAGRAEDLGGISDQELEMIVDEFRNPSDWSNLLLVKESRTEAMRGKAVARVNTLLGRQVVTDVLVHDVNLIDHSSE